MKIIKNLKFVALAALTALAVTLLFQTSITRADAHGHKGDHGQRGGGNERGNRDHRDAKVTFTKWVVDVPNKPGLIANMVGIGEGDAGDVVFTGEVLSRVVDPNNGVITRVAFYDVTGSKHSFSAIIHGVQQVAGIGQKGVVIGVVTEGWLKGHALAGEWTEMPPRGQSVPGNCFDVTLEIQRDSND
jgi:hypothetical protein